MKTLLSSKPETAVAVRGGGPLASFVRFVVCGGGIGVLSSGAVAVLAGVLPWVVANAVITVVSTVLCTELHARFTFGTGRRAGWRQHWQSAGSATGAYAVTSAAVLVLHVVRSSPGVLTEQVVYLGAAGLAGVGRFLVLRLFVFAGRRDRAVPVSVSVSVSVASSARVGVPGVTVTPVSYRSVSALSRASGLVSGSGRVWVRGGVVSARGLSWLGVGDSVRAVGYVPVVAGV